MDEYLEHVSRKQTILNLPTLYEEEGEGEFFARATKDVLVQFLRSNLSDDGASKLRLSTMRLRDMIRHAAALLTTRDNFHSLQLMMKLSALSKCSTQLLWTLSSGCGYDDTTTSALASIVSKEGMYFKVSQKLSRLPLLPIARGETLRREVTLHSLGILSQVFGEARFVDEAKRILDWCRRDAEAHGNVVTLESRISWLRGEEVLGQFEKLNDCIGDIIWHISKNVLPFLRHRPDLLLPKHCSFFDVLDFAKSLSTASTQRRIERKEVSFFQNVAHVDFTHLDLREPQLKALHSFKACDAKPSHQPDGTIVLEALVNFRAWFLDFLRLSYTECNSLEENTELPDDGVDDGDDCKEKDVRCLDHIPVFKAFIRLIEERRWRSSGSRVEPCNDQLPPLIVLPTGAGKSRVIYLAPLALSADHCPQRVLLVAPNDAVREQLIQGISTFYDSMLLRNKLHLQEASRGIKVKPIDASFNAVFDSEYDVYVACVMSLQGTELLRSFPPDFFDLIVFDEAHHAEAATYRLVREHFAGAVFLYLTATPFRGDGLELRAREIYSCTLRSAIEQTLLKRIRWAPLNVSHVCVETIWQERIVIGDGGANQIAENWHALVPLLRESRDSKLAIMGAAMKILRTLRNVSNIHHQAILQANDVNEAEELTYLWNHHKLRRSELDGEKLETLCENFNDDQMVIARLNDEYPSADFVASKRNDNEKVIEKLKSGNLDAIVHVGMVGEGFDLCNISVCCIFKHFGSFSPFMQLVGRAIRLIPNGKPEDNVAFIVSHPGMGLYPHWRALKTEADPRVDVYHHHHHSTHVEYMRLVEEMIGEDEERYFETFP